MSSNEGDGSAATEEGVGEDIDFVHLAEVAAQELREDNPGTVAVDTETSGVAFFDEAFCATIAWDRDDGDYRGHYLELSSERAFEVTREALLGARDWVFHNAKFDLQKLILAGVIERGDLAGHTIHDTEAIAHLVDPNADKRLKRLAVELLGWSDTIEVERTNGDGTYLVSAEKYNLDKARRAVGAKKEDGYGVLPREVLIPYAVADALMTIQLFDALWPRLLSRDPDLMALYEREMRLSVVLLDVEAAGMRVDMDYVNATLKKLVGFMAQQERVVLGYSGRDEFKDHHMWIKPVLADLGIEVDNTQADTLETIDHPIVAGILEYRRLKKMFDYFNAIKTEAHQGILHPSFRQHGTKTGRMSSGKAED